MGNYQDRFDFMVQKFQEGVEKTDELTKMVKESVVSFQSLDKKINETYELYQMLSNRVEDISDKISASLPNCHAEIIRIKDSANSSSSQQEQIKSNVSSLTNDSYNLNQKIQSVEKKIVEFSKTEDLSSLNVEVKKMKSEFADKLTEVNSLIDSIKSKSNEFRSSFDSLKNDVSSISSQVLEYKKEIPKIFSSVEDQRINLQNLFKSISGVSSEIDEKIASIPVPFIPSLEEALDKMRKLLEPVSLDAKNANLRSVNNEAKISLLEKKHEQLLLLAQKLQLQG